MFLYSGFLNRVGTSAFVNIKSNDFKIVGTPTEITEETRTFSQSSESNWLLHL